MEQDVSLTHSKERKTEVNNKQKKLMINVPESDSSAAQSPANTRPDRRTSFLKKLYDANDDAVVDEETVVVKKGEKLASDANKSIKATGVIAEDDGAAKTSEPTKAARSKQSLVSSHGSGGYRNGREISETFSNKVYEMKWCLLAIISNSILLWFFVQLESGVSIGFAKNDVLHFGAVFVEIILLVANIISIKALDSGFNAYYGNVMGTRGVSMTVCGFSQTSALFKLSFASELSLNSSVRKVLNRIAYLWIIAELLKLTTPFPATALMPSELNADLGFTDCIEFHQAGSPFDRNWPTFEVEAGIGELIFGSSIGVLRSESSEDLSATTAVIGPQLVGAVNDGDTIVGKGFTFDIVTNCGCSASEHASDLSAAGVPTNFATQVASLAANLTYSSQSISIVNTIVYMNESNTMEITTTFANTNLCGGLDLLSYSVCKTVFTNHQLAVVEMRYMTDGTPASIAQEIATAREILQPAKMDWLYTSMKQLMEGEVNAHELPPTVPGMLSPLLYWTSSDLLSINPSLYEVGLETMFTILGRAAIQRSYNHEGQHCIRNVVLEDQSILRIADYGLKTVLVALSIQMILSVFSMLTFMPWLLNSSPVGPAIRAVKENIYFTTLLADSNYSNNIRNLCNSPTFSIWQGLDVTVRVGEAVETVDEDVGRITMDKPKLVRKVVNGRKYL